VAKRQIYELDLAEDGDLFIITETFPVKSIGDETILLNTLGCLACEYPEIIIFKKIGCIITEKSHIKVINLNVVDKNRKLIFIPENYEVI